MSTLGEELRRKREERGITLADISESTRIGTRFLKAIETDNFSILPGGIYTRNFIRSYAEQVGMDEDEAIALYNQQVGAQVAEPQAQPVPLLASPMLEKRSRRSDSLKWRQPPTRASWPTLVITAGIVLFIALILLALVKTMNRGQEDSAQQPRDGATQPQQAPPQAGSPPATQPDKPSQAQPATEQPSPPPPPATSVASGEPLMVKLEATTGDSSIQYWVDDAAKPTSLMLRQGQAQDLPPAQNQIRLNIGNRPATKLLINNREAIYPPDTALWGAKVTISRDNLQTYFQ